MTPRRVRPATADGANPRNVRIIFQILLFAPTAFLSADTHNFYTVHVRKCECTSSSSSVRPKIDSNRINIPVAGDPTGHRNGGLTEAGRRP